MQTFLNCGSGILCLRSGSTVNAKIWGWVILRLYCLGSRQGKVKDPWNRAFWTIEGAAWKILERKQRRFQLILDAQPESLRKASQVMTHDSSGLIGFSSRFWCFLTCWKITDKLLICKHAWHLMKVDKLLQVLKLKLWLCVDDKDEDQPDPIMF